MSGKPKKRAPQRGPKNALAKPGDRFEASFDGANLNLYRAPIEAPEFAQLNPRSLDSVTKFVRQGLFFPLQFVEDNGCTTRFVLGEASEQESAEWIGRVVWKLDLRNGRLGCNELEISVPPDEYLVEVCLYLPNTSAGEILAAVAGKKAEAVWDYWMRTRPGRQLPYWIAENISPDEGVVPEELFPPDGGHSVTKGLRVKVGGRKMRLPPASPVRFADVVVRLAPLSAKIKEPLVTDGGICWWSKSKQPKPRPTSTSGYYCLWEGRKPDVCPAGLPYDP